MHLQRIQVPEFRVLKDVDITFEKEFIPRIFPLGSLNGGGKSTLLQLIFVLLHCSTDPSRTIFIKNMLDGFKIPEGSDRRVIAILDVWDGDKSVKLEFFSYKDSSARNLLLNQNGESEAGKEVDHEIDHGAEDDEGEHETDDDEYLKFSVLEEPKVIKDKISKEDDENIELQPEDLSHGELKRLSIYLWLKYRNIENAIVLMDEVEIAFHPDWQYQIISDLQEWAPSNQYILATHSYELCQALTPAHVNVRSQSYQDHIQDRLSDCKFRQV
jgi:predicted ATP-binding protein involved in virulence